MNVDSLILHQHWLQKAMVLKKIICGHKSRCVSIFLTQHIYITPIDHQQETHWTHPSSENYFLAINKLEQIHDYIQGFFANSLKRAWSFDWKNLNPLYPGRLCTKSCWNRPCGSREEDFKKWLIHFHYVTITTLEDRHDSSFELSLDSLYPRRVCAKST